MMNEIKNKFSLAGDRSLSEMYLRQPRFTHVHLMQVDYLLKIKNTKIFRNS